MSIKLRLLQLLFDFGQQNAALIFFRRWASVLSAAARSTAQPGSFHSRDNLCQFLAWCRRQLFIPDTLLFETDDLVLRKNERSVVLCLLEAARRAVRSYGFPSAPDLVRLEQEIDEELAREAAPMTSAATQAPARRRPVIEVDMMSLDEMVSYRPRTELTNIIVVSSSRLLFDSSRTV
jgi:hypothetical protein